MIAGLFAAPILAQALEIDLPEVALAGIGVDIEVRGAGPAEAVVVQVGERRQRVVSGGDGRARATIVAPHAGSFDVSVAAGGAEAAGTLRVIPGVVSILPPLLAIVIALLLRNVIPALLIGIWFGATALHEFSGRGAVAGLLDGFARFVVEALADRDHAAIILFSMMIGGMVGIITRNGGMAAIVTSVVSRASTAVRGQIAVWLMGLMVFFDDYSNTLVVGNTARALTDRLRISREKLAYLVDSTAAPVVCIALITTWIGYEVGLIGAALANLPEIDEPAYTVFLRSIPYSFYPLLAIFFVFAVASSGRDFGPMRAAEMRARGGVVAPPAKNELPALHGDVLEAKPNVPLRAVNAIVPIVLLIGTLLAGLFATGSGDTLTDIIGSADSYRAMLWASIVSAMAAAIMTLAQRILNTHETVDAWFSGVRAMFFAMIVLVLAWSLSAVTEHLHTADYLISVLGGNLLPQLVPAAVFVLSAVTAFTTGTSWGAMGILMPLVVPLCWAIMQQHGLTAPADMHILYSAVACSLAGAVWGDHCSPISDTTVLSSMASGCDHIEHVRTQMPYAALVGGVALLFGTLPAAFGVPPLVSLVAGCLALWFALRVLGRSADSAA